MYVCMLSEKKSKKKRKVFYGQKRFEVTAKISRIRFGFRNEEKEKKEKGMHA